MKEFVISTTKIETAILVGLITSSQNERKTNEYLDELEFLAQTAGAEVVKRFTQRIDHPHPVTYVGSGKLKEIAEYAKGEIESFWDEYRRIDQPHIYKVDLSDGLYELKDSMIKKIRNTKV